MTYTAEWTSLFMNWLRRQIVELNIIHPHPATGTSSPLPAASPLTGRQPATPRASHLLAQHRDVAYSLFLEEDFRIRWIAKWSYGLSLLRAVYHEGLIDLSVAARFALDILRSANRAQVSFAVALVKEFLDTIVNTATLTHHAIEVLCNKLRDLYNASECGKATEILCLDMQNIMLHLFDSSPDAFVSLSNWTRARQHLLQHDLSLAQRQQIKALDSRNALLMRGLTDLRSSPLRSSSEEEKLADIAILDSICVTRDVVNAVQLIFFDRPIGQHSVASLTRTVLIWATTKWRVGSHRPFVGATMLQLVFNRWQKPTTKPSRSNGDLNNGARSSNEKFDLDARIFSFIQEVDAASRTYSKDADGTTFSQLTSVSLPSLTILLGELARRGGFSFQKYLQRLTARGLTAANGRDVKRSAIITKNGFHDATKTPKHEADQSPPDSSGESVHSKLLRAIPLEESSAALEHQRRTAIYGKRAKESWEEAMERRAAREISCVFPWLSRAPDTGKVSSDGMTKQCVKSIREDSRLTRYWSSSRYVRSRIIKTQVTPQLRSVDWRREDLTTERLLALADLLLSSEECAPCWKLLTAILADEGVPADLRDVAHDIAEEYQIYWRALGLRNPSEAQMFKVSNTNGDPADEDHAQAHKRETSNTANIPESLKLYLKVEGQISVEEQRKLFSYAKTSSGCLALLDAAVAYAAKTNGEHQRVSKWLAFAASQSTLRRSLYSNALVAQLSDAYFNDTSQAACQLAIDMIARRLADYSVLWKQFIIPIILGVSPASGAHPPPASFHTALALGLALVHDNATDDLTALRLRAERSSFVSAETIPSLLQFVRHLCSWEDEESLEIGSRKRIISLRTSICSLPEVRVTFQSTLLQSARTIFNPFNSSTVSRILVDILPETAAVLETLKDEMTTSIVNMDVWHQHLFIIYLSLIVQNLDAQRIRGEDGASSKLLRVAKLVSDRLLGGNSHGVQSAVGSLTSLTPSASRALIAALVDERLKKLNWVLEAPDSTDEQVEQALAFLVSLLVDLHDSPLITTPACVQTVNSLSDWFERVSGTVELAMRDQRWPPEEEMAEEHRAMCARAGVLCLLLRMEDVLGPAPIKAQVPRLFKALLRWTVLRTLYSDATSEQLEPIIDVAQNVLQQSSAETQAAAQALASDYVLPSIRMRACPFDDVARRLLCLCNHSTAEFDSTRVSVLPGHLVFVEAQNIGAAVSSGRGLPVLAKPWDWHPNVDVAAAKGDADASAHSTASVTSSMELSGLTNNGPISLGHFAAHKTLDRLPQTSAAVRGGAFGGNGATAYDGDVEGDEKHSQYLHLVSEGSYGLHLGGESVFSRDAQRGHITPFTIEKVGNQSPVGGSRDRNLLSRDEIHAFIPALRPSLDAAAAKRQAVALASATAREDADDVTAADGVKVPPQHVNGASRKEDAAVSTVKPAAGTVKGRKRKSAAAAKAEGSTDEGKEKAAASTAPAARKRAKKT